MANWYVSDKVSVSGDGTSLATAFKTIQEGVNTAASSGDTVNVYSGVYNEEVVMPNRRITILGHGNPILEGGGSLLTGIRGRVHSLEGFIIQGYIGRSITTKESADCTLKNCILDKVWYEKDRDFELTNCVIKESIYVHQYRTIRFHYNTFIGSVILNRSGGLTQFVGNIFEGESRLEVNTTQDLSFANNNYTDSCRLSFNSATVGVQVDTIQDIKDVWDLQYPTVPAGNRFDMSFFHEPLYNNEAKGNYTQEYDPILNPIAFDVLAKKAIGAYQASLNYVCKSVGAGGDVNLYNTDTYSLGVTNAVGVIDDVNEKLTRSSDGAIGAFEFAAKTFGKVFKIQNFQAFGALVDRNGGQVTELASDFPYNYQIDILVKFSATLTDAQLDADTSLPFLRFRYRPNRTNYYVDNSGTLVGDGEPTYLTLVDATDGGIGVLEPIKIVAKSIKLIAILNDN